MQIVPVEGLEPPLSCEKWILNPQRLPIPPHRQYGRRKQGAELISQVNSVSRSWNW